MSNDAVRDFLRESGCGLHVIEKGLPGLIESWERFSLSRRERAGVRGSIGNYG